LLYCLFLLFPLLVLPVGVLVVSTTLGILVAVVAAVLAIPLVIAASAHYDLLRARSRYGLSGDELDEFTRLVPQLARRPEYRSLPARERNRSAKEAAAELIRGRRQDSESLPCS
jgi:hypothetical protein